MAGVRQFDRADVLDRAMVLFWKRGYEATSIRDLLTATGINRGSLYATFGDKKRLFPRRARPLWREGCQPLDRGTR
jgi:TetR/AcrR family transcriptional regulator, transcriptional repressor for nem operon